MMTLSFRNLLNPLTQQWKICRSALARRQYRSIFSEPMSSHTGCTRCCLSGTISLSMDARYHPTNLTQHFQQSPEKSVRRACQNSDQNEQLSNWQMFLWHWNKQFTSNLVLLCVLSASPDNSLPFEDNYDLCDIDLYSSSQSILDAFSLYTQALLCAQTTRKTGILALLHFWLCDHDAIWSAPKNAKVNR